MSKQSIYCYEGTSVLINKFDIKDQDKLDRVEADITSHNLSMMAKDPVKGKFDFKHLQKIHKELFKDIYDFAGKTRVTFLSKGNTEFCYPQFIEENANSMFRKLKKDNFFKGLDVEQFSEKTADLLADINMLHPFREGNGRTQREFIRELAGNSGYELDWSRISKESLYTASVKSVINTKELADSIKECIVNVEPDFKLAKEFSREFDFER